MKKLISAQTFAAAILVLLSLFAGGSATLAQSNNPGPKIGIKGGINLSQLYVDQPNVENESMKMGLHFGLFSKIPINNYVALQPEVLYTSTGSKVSYGGSDFENVFGIEPGEIRFNLNYVQVPVALAVNVGPLNVHAGPYLAYLISANVKDWKSSDTSPTEIRELDTNDFNKIDYGVVVGVGFDVKAVNVGVRYNYGLRNVGKDGLSGNLTDNSKNAVFQIYLGLGL